jgi:hypothetical protein
MHDGEGEAAGSVKMDSLTSRPLTCVKAVSLAYVEGRAPVPQPQVHLCARQQGAKQSVWSA